MKLGILFWFYKDLDVCVDRAKHLRELNPDCRIYGLYGGDLKDAQVFEERLAPFLDDFYAFPDDRSAHWKWLQGDRMIARWFEQRGHALVWDTVFIAQWDLVLLSPVSKLLSALKPDEVIFPGLRPIQEVEHWWHWVKLGGADRAEYEAFKSHVSTLGAYPAKPLCCNFLTAALPRSYLERLQSIEQPELGFLEYKLPIYAQTWGYTFCTDHPFNPIWFFEEPRSRIERALMTLHAEKMSIFTLTMLGHALLPWGKRVFHPYVTCLPKLFWFLR